MEYITPHLDSQVRRAYLWIIVFHFMRHRPRGGLKKDSDKHEERSMSKLADEIDYFTDYEVLRDPYRYFDELRSLGPVIQLKSHGGSHRI